MSRKMPGAAGWLKARLELRVRGLRPAPIELTPADNVSDHRIVRGVIRSRGGEIGIGYFDRRDAIDTKELPPVGFERVAETADLKRTERFNTVIRGADKKRFEQTMPSLTMKKNRYHFFLGDGFFEY